MYVEVWVFGKKCREWFRHWYGRTGVLEPREAHIVRKELQAQGYCTALVVKA